jgi:hypothetical protein
MPADSPDVITPRLVALGSVIEWSASMENILRDAFCSLVGSKFAATVAAGQPTGWLIGECRALTKVHREMTDAQRQAILDALDRCEHANRRRNDLVHGMKTASRVSDGHLQTIRSRKNTHVPVVTPWTPDTIYEAGAALLHAGLDLFAAIQNAVSPEMMVIGDALAWEDRQRGEGAS